MDWGRTALVVVGLACACTFDASAFGTSEDVAVPGSSTSTGIDATSTSGGSTTREPSPESSTADPTTAPPGTSSSEDDSTTGSESSSTSGVTPIACTDPAWWAPEWRRRRALEVAGAETAELENVAVLLRLGAERIDYAATHAMGHDLRFVVGEDTLAYEIERWIPNGESIVWLHVPLLASAVTGPTEITMYYGNQAATLDTDAASTWTGYVTVHHLESLTASVGMNELSPINGPIPPLVEGMIGGARQLNGTQSLSLPSENQYDFTNAMTVEAIIRVDGFADEWEAIVTKGDSAWRLHRAGFMRVASFGHDNSGTSHNLDGAAPIDDNQWHYVAATHELASNSKRLFVDGMLDQQGPANGNIQTSNDPVRIGGNAEQFGRELEGSIDEVRISAIAREPAYFGWQWQAINGKGVVTFGPDVACE